MLLTLANFSPEPAQPWAVGTTVTGQLLLTTETPLRLKAVGFQLGVWVQTKEKKTFVAWSSQRLDEGVTLDADERLEYDITFTVPALSPYAGNLFLLRTGIRAYASPAATEDTLYDFQPYRITEVSQATVRERNMPLIIERHDYPAIDQKVLVLGGIALGACCLPAPLSLALVSIMVMLICYHIMANLDGRNPTDFRVTAGLRPAGPNGFLVDIHVGAFADQIESLRSLYVVREERTITDSEGTSNLERIIAREPSQPLILNADDRAVAEHPYPKNYPLPFRLGGVAVRYVYLLEAELKNGGSFRYYGFLMG